MTVMTHSEIEHLLRTVILPFCHIKRDMPLPIGERRWENDAEHSWSLAFLACTLAPEIDLDLDIGKVAQYAIVHDLVEIYANDVSVLLGTDEQKANKERLEHEALERLEIEYAHFPWITQTIREYESRESAEAKFVYALDKYLPVAYDWIDEGAYLHEAKHTKSSYDKALMPHRKKAHTHPTVGEYYDEIRRKLDEHPEYFSPEVSARCLITGVAGSGKSTLERAFAARGYVTIDIDDGYAEWRHADTDELLEYNPDDASWHRVAEWVVKTDKLQDFFDVHADDIVLVFGSFARIKTVVGMFDKIILLEYPGAETARQRITGRKDGYGKNPHELERILSYIEPYQQKMKSHGAHAISCTLPIDESIKLIEEIVRQ